jgi:pimeloyl-ACP methyl ester carboxylesterase
VEIAPYNQIWPARSVQMGGELRDALGTTALRIDHISSTEGYPVMLCNGGAGCCDYLAPVADMLDDVAQVIRFEQRGCGRSQTVPPYDIETCMIDLENVRRHFNP